MAKKPNIAGFAAGATETQTTVIKLQEEQLEMIEVKEAKKVEAKPARKKRNPDYTIKRTKGKIEIITKAESKVNKTYYLEQSCVDTIEEISNNTMLNPSEIIKLAIQELNAKLVYKQEDNKL